MKAITLWQPWATFMALGLKRNETRSWPTRHRGELAVCSAVRRPPDLSLEVMRRLMETPYFNKDEDEVVADTLRKLPYGKVLCVVTVADCVPSRRFGPDGDLRLDPGEFDLGDYRPGRWAWRTATVFRLPRPVGVVGRQGLFELDPGTEAAVKAQI